MTDKKHKRTSTSRVSILDAMRDWTGIPWQDETRLQEIQGMAERQFPGVLARILHPPGTVQLDNVGLDHSTTDDELRAIGALIRTVRQFGVVVCLEVGTQRRVAKVQTLRTPNEPQPLVNRPQPEHS
jgi:hypothetical protein